MQSAFGFVCFSFRRDLGCRCCWLVCYLSVFCLYTHFVPWFRTCLIMFSNGLYTYIYMCVFRRMDWNIFAHVNATSWGWSFLHFITQLRRTVGKDAGSSDLQPSMCRIHEQLGTITCHTSIPQSRCQVFDVGFLIAQLVPVSDSFRYETTTGVSWLQSRKPLKHFCRAH